MTGGRIAAHPFLSACVAFAAGALAGLGQAPTGYWVLTVLGLALGIFLSARARSWRVSFLTGWALGAGYFAVVFRWLVEPFQVDAAVYGWMAPFAISSMAAGLALFWGVAAGFGFGLGRSVAGRAVLTGLGVVLAEYVRSFVLTGLPWGLVGYALETTPMVQAAALVGPYGLTLMVCLLAAGLAAGRSRAGAALGLSALAALVAAWQFGTSRVERIATAGGPVVRVVQPNAPQHLKWDPKHAPKFLARALVETGAPRNSPALIVWPETAITPWLSEAGRTFEMIEAVAPDEAEVILGLRRWDGTRVYNSLVRLDATGAPADVYDKTHLVPFGEYVPFGDVLGALGLRGLAAGDGNGFSAGPGAVILESAAGRYLPLICYEAIFPAAVRRAVRDRPDFMVQITNDAWFGPDAGPAQHFAQARLRAIETGLPLVRSANTGISAVIDPMGRTVARLGMNTAGHVDAALPRALPPTPYARFGDVPVIAFVLMLGGIVLWRRRKI